MRLSSKYKISLSIPNICNDKTTVIALSLIVDGLLTSLVIGRPNPWSKALSDPLT